jgi:hypothetical protein
MATCSDGLTCVVTEGAGVCTPYCDTSHPCPSGDSCVAKTVELGLSPPVINVCEPEGVDCGEFQIDGESPPPPVDSGVGDSMAPSDAKIDGERLHHDGGLPM